MSHRAPSMKYFRLTAARFIRAIRKDLRAGKCSAAERDYRVLLEYAGDIRYGATTKRQLRNAISACHRKHG